MEVMMAVKAESTGIKGIDLVLPAQRLDDICNRLLTFSSTGIEINDSTLAMQYFAIQCVTKLASLDRYCIASLERTDTRKRLETIALEGREAGTVLPALIKCAPDEIQKPHPITPPTWWSVSNIDFGNPRTCASLLRIGDSYEPDQHWFSGRRRVGGHYSLGRLS